MPSFRGPQGLAGVHAKLRRQTIEISSEDARQHVCRAGREIWENFTVGDLRTRGTGADGRSLRPDLLQGEPRRRRRSSIRAQRSDGAQRDCIVMIRAVSYSDLSKSKNRSARLILCAGSTERNVVHTGLAASRLAAARNERCAIPCQSMAQVGQHGGKAQIAPRV